MLDRTHVPRFFVYVALLLLCLLMVPPAVVARLRAAPNGNRRIHLIQDMDNQSRFGPQQANAMFADDRAMRPSIAGTVARDDVREVGVLTTGIVTVSAGGAAAAREGDAATIDEAWSRVLPAEVPLTMETLRRGQDRFNIYCALCHGYAGFGDGMIHQRAAELAANSLGPVNGTMWVQPRSMHEDEVAVQPVGQIFNTITHGIRTMAGYGAQIPPEDRWAIAAYVKALQASQNADPSTLSDAVRTRLGL